jgi:pilus assembly protein CpaB
MSTDSNSDALWHLADALSEDILNTPAEDLFAEVAADHGNRRALATEFDRISRRGLRRVRRQEYIERLKQLINLLGPTPRFAITSIGGLNSILMLVVAILLGGVAALLADNWLVSRTQVATTTTTIVIAARPLPFGTPLTKDSIQEIPWAASVVPVGSFTSKEALFKDGRRMALATIQENEPILTAEITGPGERAPLSTLLDKDKRAITVRVDDVRGVAGFILPNDRVDVVLIRGATDGSGSRQSDLLLQDVKVIAVDQIAAQQKDNPVVAKAVTLEVTPYEAQKISLATSIGSLSLILRKAGDANLVANSRVTEIDLSDEPRRAPPPAPAPTPVKIESPPPPPPPTDATVTIIRNLKGMDYKVMKEGHGGRGS